MPSRDARCDNVPGQDSTRDTAKQGKRKGRGTRAFLRRRRRRGANRIRELRWVCGAFGPICLHEAGCSSRVQYLRRPKQAIAMTACCKASDRKIQPVAAVMRSMPVLCQGSWSALCAPLLNQTGGGPLVDRSQSETPRRRLGDWSATSEPVRTSTRPALQCRTPCKLEHRAVLLCHTIKS